jgi:energy-coupling factor transporter ATP-binding protein EcfA2
VAVTPPGGFDIASVRVAGPSPLGPVDVPVRTGLTALYGRNGAGKTRLLQALKEALSGRREDAEVTVRIHDADTTAERVTEAHRSWLGKVAPPDLSHHGPFPWRESGRTALEAAAGDSLLDRWALTERWTGWGGGSHDRPPVAAVVDEVVRNMEWVLRSTRDEVKPGPVVGTQGERPTRKGTWDLCVAVRLTEKTPLLAGLHRRFLSAWEATVERLPMRDEMTLEEWEPQGGEREEALGAFGAQLSPRDFFTVLGPMVDLRFHDTEAFWEAVDVLRRPDRLIHVATLCEAVHRGPLCNVVDDVTHIEELPTATLDAVIARNHLLSAASQNPDDEHVLDWTRFGLVNAPPPMIEIAGDTADVAGWVRESLDTLISTLNTLLADMLPEPPVLVCRINRPEYWATGEVFNWSAIDLTGATVDLSSLSGAQARLVSLAFRLAFDALERDVDDHSPFRIDPRELSTVVLLDEPEAGLHRLAEDKLGRALHVFGVRNGMAVVAATHSTSFLAIPEVSLVEVFRAKQGWTSTRPVEFPDQAGPNSLGINRGDLLQLYQLILLVEGHHERLVLGEMLGSELGRRRVLPIPLRGSFNLNAVVDLEILAHTLEQPVLAVLDNANADAIDRLWEGLRDLPEGTEDLTAVLEDSLGPASERSDEEKQIASLAKNLLAAGQLDRFDVYALSRSDIVEFLPVERLVPSATSWEELRTEHQQLRAEATGSTPRDFKRWLTEHRQADFGDDAIVLAAAVAAASPPEELLGLLARIDSIVDGWTR